MFSPIQYQRIFMDRFYVRDRLQYKTNTFKDVNYIKSS